MIHHSSALPEQILRQPWMRAGRPALRVGTHHADDNQPPAIRKAIHRRTEHVTAYALVDHVNTLGVLGPENILRRHNKRGEMFTLRQGLALVKETIT